jgi:hypothetical protein
VRESGELRSRRIALLCGLLLLTGGCATVPFEQTGALSSYQGLETSNGVLTRARISVNSDGLQAAKTLRLLSTSFSDGAARAGLSDLQRNLVANAIDRGMCLGAGERFRIVGPGEPADLTVHATVTYVGLTDEALAGVSRAASIGTSVAEKVLMPASVPVSIPAPRIPFGLGALAVEVEALDQRGAQQAAMIWARGADAFTSKPKVSKTGDAYDLARSFAGDFSGLLVTGASPFMKLPSIPSLQSMGAMLGGAPKDAACEAFGRAPGIKGFIGDTIGLPPEWTDKGRASDGNRADPPGR